MKVLRRCWKHVAARFGAESPDQPDLFIINKVGTYWLASAQFWWGRVAALINRLLIASGFASRTFIYVDDLLIVGERPDYSMAMLQKEFLLKDTSRLEKTDNGLSSLAGLFDETATAASVDARRTTSMRSWRR